jgi:hypothetical protein
MLGSGRSSWGIAGEVLRPKFVMGGLCVDPPSTCQVTSRADAPSPRPAPPDYSRSTPGSGPGSVVPQAMALCARRRHRGKSWGRSKFASRVSAQCRLGPSVAQVLDRRFDHLVAPGSDADDARLHDNVRLHADALQLVAISKAYFLTRETHEQIAGSNHICDVADCLHTGYRLSRNCEPGRSPSASQGHYLWS